MNRREFLGLLAAPLGAGDVDRQIRRWAEEAPLQMRFRGSTPQDCRRWQAAFQEKLRSLLGPHQPPKQWKTSVERSVELDDHRRDELLLEAEGHAALPVYLLIPRREGKRPGMVALHGHGTFGYDSVVGREGSEAEIAKLRYDYGRELVRRGYVVAAPCLTPFGRRLGDRKAYGRQDPCAVTHVRLQLLGKLLMAENLRDALWSVELLARRPEVDPERLGCAGLSYGGRMTMLAAALEPRIRVAAISGAMNCMQERISGRYSCGAQVIPGLLQYGDVPEIASLIAPRPCLWEVGSQDALMVPRWVDIAQERIRAAYAALGAAGKLHVERFDGGHVWNGRGAYRVLEQHLVAR